MHVTAWFRSDDRRFRTSFSSAVYKAPAISSASEVKLFSVVRRVSRVWIWEGVGGEVESEVWGRGGKGRMRRFFRAG